MNEILSFILPFSPPVCQNTKRWDSHSFSVSPLFRKKKEKGEWMRKSHSFSFILPFSWMRFSHSFSLSFFFWQNEGETGKNQWKRGNEWEWMRFSHSFSFILPFLHFLEKNWKRGNEWEWMRKEWMRFSHSFSFILPFSVFFQKSGEKGEWMRMNEKISFILIHSHFWNFNKRSSPFCVEKISVPALFLRRK